MNANEMTLASISVNASSSSSTIMNWSTDPKTSPNTTLNAKTIRICILDRNRLRTWVRMRIRQQIWMPIRSTCYSLRHPEFNDPLVVFVLVLSCCDTCAHLQSTRKYSQFVTQRLDMEGTSPKRRWLSWWKRRIYRVIKLFLWCTAAGILGPHEFLSNVRVTDKIRRHQGTIFQNRWNFNCFGWSLLQAESFRRQEFEFYLPGPWKHNVVALLQNRFLSRKCDFLDFWSWSTGHKIQ